MREHSTPSAVTRGPTVGPLACTAGKTLALYSLTQCHIPTYTCLPHISTGAAVELSRTTAFTQSMKCLHHCPVDVSHSRRVPQTQAASSCALVVNRSTP